MEGARRQGLAALIRAILAAYEDADAEHKLQLEALEALPADRQAPLVALHRRLVQAMAAAVARRAFQPSQARFA